MTRPSLFDTLTVLEYAELVRALQESEYIFEHALVQDTAYTSLLKQERKRLHSAIGETLEKVYATHADEFAAELARHFSEAGEAAKTCLYGERAGDAAARVFALTEAQGQYQRALDAAERLDAPPPQRRARAGLFCGFVSGGICGIGAAARQAGRGKRTGGTRGGTGAGGRELFFGGLGMARVGTSKDA